MSNVNRMYFKLNAFEVVAVEPGRRQRGELAVVLYGGKVVLSRVIRHMEGATVLGKVVQLQRNYSAGTLPLNMADVKNERSFYNSLPAFAKTLYRGLLKAEELYSFADYNRAAAYFFERLNRRRMQSADAGVKRESAECL